MTYGPINHRGITMSEPAPEYVWVRYKRQAAIKITVDQVDEYLAQGYVVVPIRDEPTQ